MGADTGASQEDMQSQVDAYQESMLELKKKVLPMGGFWWQLMAGQWNHGHNQFELQLMNATQCKATLRQLCVPKPKTWNKFQLYAIPNGGKDATAQNFTDWTAEFLLTRGPYALLGYSWCGCTSGQQARPRAKEWDEDFGEPLDSGAACQETGAGTGVFERKWTKANVQWDCSAGHGKIERLDGMVVL